jgi:hypothetical protein
MTGHGFSVAYLTSLCSSHFILWSWLYCFLSGGAGSTHYDNNSFAGALSVDFTITLSRQLKYRWLRSNTLLRLCLRYRHVIFRSKSTAVSPPVLKIFLAPVPSLLTQRYDSLCCPNNAGGWTTRSCALVFTIETLLIVSRRHRRLHALRKSFQGGCFVRCLSDTTFAVTEAMPVADQHVLAPSSQPSTPLYSFTDRTNDWLGFSNCTLSSALFAAFTVWLPCR